MSNYNNFRPQSNGGGNYSQNGGSFRNGFNGNNKNYQRDQQQKKRSGCKRKESYRRHSTNETINAPCFTGWRASTSQRPFTKFVAVPAKDPKTKNANFLKFVATIQPEGQKSYLETAFLNLKTGRLHFADSGLIANPAKDYWGIAYTPKK